MGRPKGLGPTPGSWKKGQSGNPHGVTSEQKLAAQTLAMRLDAPEYREAFLTAYLMRLKEGNQPILIDYANRKLGKAPEILEVREDRPAASLTVEQLLAIARATEPQGD